MAKRHKEKCGRLFQNIMALVAETVVAGLFRNAQQAIPIQRT